ncbi:MAG: type I restriction-modification system endonuclease [Comamonadaceae bacterium]|nr:type I restriction-modification system endonuclease [Comamonadaceae bacterium]
MPTQATSSANFAFLERDDPLLAQLGASAERYCHADPNACLLKLRQFGEAVAQHVAAVHGFMVGGDRSQADLLTELRRRQVLDGDVMSMLHLLRSHGNNGVHNFQTEARGAADALRIARQLGIWFYRAFRNPGPAFRPGPFVMPTVVLYEDVVRRQAEDLQRLQVALHAAQAEVESERQQRHQMQAVAEHQAGERQVWEQLAQAEEAERKRLQAEFDARIALLASDSRMEGLAGTALGFVAANESAAQAMARATREIDLDETETRTLIDRQLRDAGWEADSTELRFGKGVRPERDRCMAIAEWPTASGPADYVLFHGLRAIAVVEAKKFSTDVSAVIGQAERYSLGFNSLHGGEFARPLNWPEEQAASFAGWPAQASVVEGATHYRVPFVYASNGRGYHRQFETRSGVWFRDLRRSSNHAGALAGWHTPDGLLALLGQDVDAAERQLAAEPFGYLNLRDYQVRAVQAVEAAVARGDRQALVAMATGTGKTRTVIGLIYRLLKAQRFRRVLFLVDRSSLGEQAQNAFKDARLEQNRRFTEIYELKELADITPDAATKVHVATVQGMVRRLFGSDDTGSMPIDRYDCIIIDEAHRGYILDREMGEGELQFRDEGDYISAYRRVLDQFDAVKIALTATPAQHTTQIFGNPVYTYTYQEAVIDGWLVDHLPPIRMRTLLAANGIHFDSGETVTVLNTLGSSEERVLPDEVDYEVDHFNRLVLTPDFNRVVCEELARQLDPFGEEKTLVFCANDQHADLVVRLLTDALEREHGPVHAKTVLKITGRADRPDELIRLFKNEALPKIAVTVDLLSTGIDVPRIANIVFLRRVRSRILYEQMLGRATRLCPQIGKEYFRIFDAVDLYAALDAVNTMRPVVQNANIPLAQLIQELQDPAAAATVIGLHPRTQQQITHADQVRDQVLVRVRNLLNRAHRLAGQRPEVQQALQQLQLLTGRDPRQLAALLRAMPLDDLRAFLGQHGGALLALRTDTAPSAGVDMVLAPHQDQLLSVEHGWGSYQRPEDYLSAFHAFIRDNVNRIAALDIVLTRPRELTGEHLRTLLVELARHQFTEPAVRTAFAKARHEDVAATIVGYIRQSALGSPLVPFATRVDRAVERLRARQTWTAPQLRWLERIATTLKDKVAVDEATFDHGAYASYGGFKAIDQVFAGQGRAVLSALEDEVWNDAA